LEEVVIEIEKDVPCVASGRRGPVNIYPWEDMEVGDSFVVPFDQARKVRSAMYLQNRRGEKFFVSAREGDNVRIWRRE
jgi:hypothetical protein